MAFRLSRYAVAGTGPSYQTVVIDNSDVIEVGDYVKMRNGNLEVVTAGDAGSGVVVDVVNSNGLSLAPEQGSIASAGSATISSGVVTVASDNETVDLIAAKIDMSPFAVYSATVTGTINTTATSAKPGAYINTDDENSIDETTATRTIGTGGQFVTFPSLTPANGARDDNDTTRLLVVINEHEFWNNGAALA